MLSSPAVLNWATILIQAYIVSSSVIPGQGNPCFAARCTNTMRTQKLWKYQVDAEQIKCVPSEKKQNDSGSKAQLKRRPVHKHVVVAGVVFQVVLLVCIRTPWNVASWVSPPQWQKNFQCDTQTHHTLELLWRGVCHHSDQSVPLL